MRRLKAVVAVIGLGLLLAVALSARSARSSADMLSRVHVQYTPLGIWPLCDVGVAMPGCSADMLRQWLEVVYRELPGGGVFVVQTRIVDRPGEWM